MAIILEHELVDFLIILPFRHKSSIIIWISQCAGDTVQMCRYEPKILIRLRAVKYPIFVSSQIACQRLLQECTKIQYDGVSNSRLFIIEALMFLHY